MNIKNYPRKIYGNYFPYVFEFETYPSGKTEVVCGDEVFDNVEYIRSDVVEELIDDASKSGPLVGGWNKFPKDKPKEGALCLVRIFLKDSKKLFYTVKYFDGRHFKDKKDEMCSYHTILYTNGVTHWREVIEPMDIEE